ncbi:uncharacterized protein PG986_001922 [Apiospora aurea]|uniref:DUF7908 domain-containing protein n=1 Tax=Apiospora aurea TaxID=335848 RepID=A0ABR1QY80_9PEZI
MHRHGVLALLLFGVHGTFAASSCSFDTCLKITETITPSSSTLGSPSSSPLAIFTSSNGSNGSNGSSSISPTNTVSSASTPDATRSVTSLSTPFDGPSSATTRTTASATTENVPVLLTVVPSIPGPPNNGKRAFRRRGRHKRQDTTGGFVEAGGTVETCSDGTPFNITTQGQLTSDGRIVSTRPGDVFIPLAPSDDERGISTAFVVIGSVLH